MFVSNRTSFASLRSRSETSRREAKSEERRKERTVTNETSVENDEQVVRVPEGLETRATNRVNR
jgi:hypothetical protein